MRSQGFQRIFQNASFRTSMNNYFFHCAETLNWNNNQFLEQKINILREITFYEGFIPQAS